jgi:hypothetical protein
LINPVEKQNEILWDFPKLIFPFNTTIKLPLDQPIHYNTDHYNSRAHIQILNVFTTPRTIHYQASVPDVQCSNLNPALLSPSAPPRPLHVASPAPPNRHWSLHSKRQGVERAALWRLVAANLTADFIIFIHPFYSSNSESVTPLASDGQHGPVTAWAEQDSLTRAQPLDAELDPNRTV